MCEISGRRGVKFDISAGRESHRRPSHVNDSRIALHFLHSGVEDRTDFVNDDGLARLGSACLGIAWRPVHWIRTALPDKGSASSPLLVYIRRSWRSRFHGAIAYVTPGLLTIDLVMALRA